MSIDSLGAISTNESCYITPLIATYTATFGTDFELEHDDIAIASYWATMRGTRQWPAGLEFTALQGKATGDIISGTFGSEGLYLDRHTYVRVKESVVTACCNARLNAHKRGHAHGALQVGRAIYSNAFSGNVPDWLAVLEVEFECGPDLAAHQELMDKSADPGTHAIYGAKRSFVYSTADRLVAHSMKRSEADTRLEHRGYDVNDYDVFETQEQALRHNNACVSAVLRALHEGEQALADVLYYYFPCMDRSLYLRSRFSYRLLSRLIRFTVSNGTLAEDHLALLCRTFVNLGHQAFSCFLMLTLTTTHGRALIEFLVDGGYFFGGFKEVEKKLKSLHTIARRNRWVPRRLRAFNVEPGSLMYLTSLLGRFYLDTAANDSTVEDRCAYFGEHVSHDSVTGTHTAEKHWERMEGFFAARAKSAAAAWRGSDVDSLTEWLDRYIGFAASGSAGTHTGDSFGVEHSVSKRLWLSDQEEGTVAWYVLEQPVGASTTTVVKREAGKLRQLLPAGVPHWMVEVQLIKEIEGRIYRDMPLSLEMTAYDEWFGVMDRRKRMVDGEAIACIDWADFNITHTLRDMSRYFWWLGEAALKACPEPNFAGNMTKGEYLKQAAEWCSATLYNLWLRNGAEKDAEFEHAARGLWSGWQTTSFINSSFNVGYCEDVFASIKDMWGEFEMSCRYHAGDDFHGNVAHEIDGLRLIAAMAWAKHDLNPSKQLAAGDVGEFLRNEYLRDGRVLGSINRSIAGFVGSDMQSPEIHSGLEQAQGTNESLHMMIRRGADAAMVERIRYLIVGFWSTVKAPRTGRVVQPSIEVMARSARSGGMGCSRYGVLPDEYNDTMPRMLVMRDVPLEIRVPRNASRIMQGLVSRLHAFGFTHCRTELLRNDVLHATYGADWPSDVKNDLISNLREAQADWVLAANEHQQQSVRALLPDVPREVSEFIDRCVQTSFDRKEMEGGCSDLNGIADGMRAISLGKFAAADASLGYLAQGASRVAGFDAVLAMSEGRCAAQLATLRKYLSEECYRQLVEHKWHLPTNTAGVIAPAVRAVTFAVVNYALSWMKYHWAGAWHVPDTVSRYVVAVLQRLANAWRKDQKFINM
ncbi:122 kDa protein [Pleosporales megabirnavirus 1]|uniref:RNA-directed RNA polymerase n=1 Tax=Pleosporales megabirnavirus 1 TaxID=1755794 RepID=A0A0S2KPB1_9VIRU|nr:122 kDa protein [Pleosporales megabirnavirus 1]